MPWKDAATRRRKQAEIMRRWRRNNRLRAMQQNRENLRKWRLARAERAQERKWRYLHWMLRRPLVSEVYEMEFSVVSQQELDSPLFIFEHEGHRRRETLSEPLPTW